MNDHVKEFLKKKLEFRYAQQITNHLDGGGSVYDVQVRLNFRLSIRFIPNRC